MATIECKTYFSNAHIPKRAYKGSGGYNVYAAETKTLKPWGRTLMKLDLNIALLHLNIGIKLYHYRDMADLHYKLLNILSLICYHSDYYNFCNRYQGCKKDYHLGRNLCLLCRRKIYFQHDLGNFGEYLDKNQFNLSKLKTYAFRLDPFLMEYYYVDKRSLEVFSGHYV